MEWIKGIFMLIGRILLVLIFFNSGIGKIGNFAATTQYMAQFGMPYATFFLFGAILLEVVGSGLIILGFFTRLGLCLILLFLIPATMIFHTDFRDQVQMIMLMKNVSMLGGCLILLGSGPGRLSLDYLLNGRKRKKR